MYSDGDRLVWRSHVEQFVARRRDQGSIGETRHFGRTPHVGHFRAQPDTYRETLAGWLEAVEK